MKTGSLTNVSMENEVTAVGLNADRESGSSGKVILVLAASILEMPK